ncbi:hypothetical protein CRG98_034276 [Punica granatum]|uniref:Uncharacterized protein n=1 Tax=Punica granatum TaxID=22663 RepID=A0A2I0IMT9_PUNGR|nr:hypothetical protein CRG98_034276 [Punica granatum]
MRGRDHQLATPTPPPRSLVSSVGTSDLCGGVGVADWRPRPLLPFRFSFRTKMEKSPVDSGLGPPIGDPDLSTEVVRVLRGYRLPRWRGRGRRLAAQTLNLPGTSYSESPVDSGLGPPIGDPDLSTEVVRVLRGYRLPRWRGRGRRLAASTPPPLSIFF